MLAYHARPYPEPHTNSAAGGLFDPDRNTWFKAVNVRANGDLDLSLSSAQEVAPGNRTVTVRVVVGDPPPAALRVSATTRCVAGKVVLVASLANDGSAAESARVTTGSGEKTVEVPAGKAVTISFSTRQQALGAGSITVVTSASDAPIQAAYAAAVCG